MAPALVLSKAADLLVSAGWIWGKYRSHCGFCVLGAIREVLGIDSDDEMNECPLFFDAVRLLAERLGILADVEDHGFGAIARWNDNGARRFDEVVAALRAA